MCTCSRKCSINLFDSSDAVCICHDFSLECLMFLQTLHLVLNVSDIVEAFCLRNLQLVFNPSFSLRIHHKKLRIITVPDYHDLQLLQVNSALHPSRVAKSSTSFGWSKGGKVTAAG